MPSVLESLRPRGTKTIYELVAQAGIDVSDWASYRRPNNPAANPRYCYEWSFIEPGKFVVLPLWHYNLKEVDDVVSWAPGKPLTDEEERVLREHPLKPRAAANWLRRAKCFEEHVATAWREKLPIRVIVANGTPGVLTNGRQTKAKATGRMLDPVPWAVTAFNPSTGMATIVRGASPIRFVDQWETREPEDQECVTQKIVERREWSRNGQVRQAALRRSKGLCEYCGQPGFEMSSGVYLETHHVVPLAEGGADVDENVIALCPNCHRMAHHWIGRESMRVDLQASLGRCRMDSKGGDPAHKSGGSSGDA